MCLWQWVHTFTKLVYTEFITPVHTEQSADADNYCLVAPPPTGKWQSEQVDLTMYLQSKKKKKCTG